MSLSSPKNSNSEEDYYKPYSEEIFEVESILESRLNPRLNKQEYLVKWKRWQDENTWEPATNLRSYAKILVEFEENKKRSKQMAKSSQMSKKLKSEPEVKGNSQPTKINNNLKSEVAEKEISGRLRSQQQSKDKRGSSFNSFFEEEDADEDDNTSEFDEDYVPYSREKQSLKHNLSDSMKSTSMVNEDEENHVDQGDDEDYDDDYGEVDENEEEDQLGAHKLSKKQKKNNVDEELLLLKREFAMKYSMPLEHKNSSVEDASTNSSQELTQKASLQLGAEESKPKAARRLAKRSKPATQEESELGGFLIDDISEITATITYEYTVNFKHRPNLAVQPEAQQLSFTKVRQITPDQFISELSEHYVNNYKKD